jgi:hypothetical protein
MRSPGTRLHKLALFGWAVVVTAVLLLLSLPVLAGMFIVKYSIGHVTSPISLSLIKQFKTITFENIPSELKDIIIRLGLGDLHTRNNKIKKPYLVYIKNDSWNKFKSLIEPHVIPQFKYKLKLRGTFSNKNLDEPTARSDNLFQGITPLNSSVIPLNCFVTNEFFLCKQKNCFKVYWYLIFGILMWYLIVPALNLAVYWELLNTYLTQSVVNLESLDFLKIFRGHTPKLAICEYKNGISIRYASTKYNFENNYSKECDENFAYYLTGLIEGDGSIIVPKVERSEKGKINSPSVKIAFDLRDFPLAQLIQKNLGCGSLVRMKGINAYLLQINNTEGVLLLISLLNGKMKTSKIHSLYALIDWFNTKDPSLNIPKKPLNLSTIDQNSWFAGFIDSDGSFSLFINKKSIRLRFSITQTSESKLKFSNAPIMNILAEFLNVNVSSVRWAEPSGCIARAAHARRYEYKKPPYSLVLTVKTQSIKNNEILINYLSKFPLWSSKYLNYIDWLKAFEIFKQVYRIGNKSDEIYDELTLIKKGMNNDRTIFNWDHLQKFYNLSK